MVKVTVLPVDENVSLNPVILQHLSLQLGPEVADNVICQTLEDLAVRLAAAERYYNDEDDKRLRREIGMLGGLADQLGMSALRRVAIDGMACVDRKDRVATAAVLSRMTRLGQASMTAVWDHQEQVF